MPGCDVWHGRLLPQADKVMVGAGLPDWLPDEMGTFNVVRTSQSFIEGWRKCPRSAVAERRPTYGLAAAEGIVAHAIVDGRIESQGVDPAIDAASAKAKIDELSVGGWLSPGDHFMEAALAKAGVLTDLYLDLYHQYQPNVATEVSGQMVFDVRDDHRTAVDFIIITGTADLVIDQGTTKLGIDWKTGSTMPEPWMVQRYGVQWRIYSAMFELDAMKFHYPIALNPLDGSKGHWVATRYKGVVECHANHLERQAFRRQILEECIPIATRLLASEDPNDHDIRPTDWHCSAKWCQVFARRECMGGDGNVMWIDKSHREAPEAAGAIQTNRSN